MKQPEEKLKKLISTNEQEEIGLIDLTSENPDLKHQIESLLALLETGNLDELEEAATALLRNMMNFFARFVEDIPSFDSLTPEQKKKLLLKFRELAQNLAGRKIKSIEEITQIFVFSILSSIGECVAGAQDLTAIEIMNKKHKHAFREFLRRAADYEAYKIINPKQIAGETKEENFIANAVVLGVKEAMKHAGISYEEQKVDRSVFKILENAHVNFLRNKTGILQGMGMKF